MASLMEEIADALARDTLRVVDETGDEDLIALVGRTIGASSTTTQEAFMTAVRVRIAEERARRLLAQRADDDWPLKPYAPGGVMVAGAVPALPPPSMPAPREPRRSSVFDGPPLPPDEPPMGHEPIIEDEEPEEEEDPEVEPEPAPIAEEPPPPEPLPDDGRIRPRHPGAQPRVPAAAAAPVSIEAALALATSLPRKPLAEVEKPKADPLYPDVEIPDGDWG